MLPKYSCKECDYKSTRKENIMTHVKATHVGVKFLCEQCNYKATFKGNLLRHIKSTHVGVKFP